MSESLRRGAGHQADRGEVWDGVATQAVRFGVASPTGAMHDAIDGLHGAALVADERIAHLMAFPVVAAR